MNPTLNQADLKLLKSVFLTKEDLIAFEKRLDQKFASKTDLKKFATKEDLEKLKTEIFQTVVSKKDLEELEEVLAQQFAKLEQKDSELEHKISLITNL